MYKIGDVKPYLFDTLKKAVGNHMFIALFVFVVVFIGTIGIWIQPVFLDKTGDFASFITSFVNSFDAKNLLSFSMPLIAGVIFDKALTMYRLNNGNAGVYTWLIVCFFISTIVIVFLYALAFKFGNGFSWLSFIAWIMTLMLWVLSNANNQNYQMKLNQASPIGGEEADAETLLDGE